MRISSLALSLLVMLSGVTAACQARADEPAAKDVMTIEACLRKQLKNPDDTQEADAAACLMKVAKPCIGDEAASPPSQTLACLERERLVWDKFVNDSYNAMMSGLDPDQQVKLRDMQRSWIHTRDLTCMFWYDYFQGTMANPMIAYCNNRETARRAIFLRIFAADIADRK